MCVGVAMVELPSGEIVGRRAKPFDYSGKVILSLKDYEARIEKEIKRVKDLASGGEWIEKRRKKGELWANDTVDKITGVGEKSRQS